MLKGEREEKSFPRHPSDPHKYQWMEERKNFRTKSRKIFRNDEVKGIFCGDVFAGFWWVYTEKLQLVI